MRADLTSRDDAAALDRVDPLGPWRTRFQLPEGLIYLDGNSLGAMVHAVPDRLAQVTREQWGNQLIAAWDTAGWIDLPARAGARIARLIGAGGREVVVTDSTSVNLFKLLVAATRMRPGRRVVVMEPTTFPTDGYIAASTARLLDLDLRWCDPDDPAAALCDDVAVLALTHVDYRTGRMYDLPTLTQAAHASGALVLWDLCHSVGAVEVDLTAAGADLAVGCTYKYLNGGPGAPAFAYVASALQDDLDQPLTGWLGHAEPFGFEPDYRPAPHTTRLRVGSPPILSMSALEAALTVFDDVSMAAVRQKSLTLTTLFMDLVEARCRADDLEVVTPREAERRGSQVSVRTPAASRVVAELVARRVVGDFRSPDIARFGFAPLYLRYVDVWDAAGHLAEVVNDAA